MAKSKERDQTRFQSTVPFFEHRPGPLEEYCCQRIDCGKSFFTDGPLEKSTAPCPWCMKVGRVPS